MASPSPARRPPATHCQPAPSGSSASTASPADPDEFLSLSYVSGAGGHLPHLPGYLCHCAWQSPCAAGGGPSTSHLVPPVQARPWRRRPEWCRFLLSPRWPQGQIRPTSAVLPGGLQQRLPWPMGFPAGVPMDGLSGFMARGGRGRSCVHEAGVEGNTPEVGGMHSKDPMVYSGGCALLQFCPLNLAVVEQAVPHICTNGCSKEEGKTSRNNLRTGKPTGLVEAPRGRRQMRSKRNALETPCCAHGM